jgi:hypothetical protein
MALSDEGRSRRRRPRSWTIALPAGLVVLGVVTIGPSQILGTTFIVGAVASAAAAAAATVVRRRRR